MKRSGWSARWLGLLFLASASASAKDAGVIAVISYDLAPFEAAWNGFQAGMNTPVTVVHMAREKLHIAGEPRVIVAFGGKAATENYPESSALIYCMAPGTSLPLAGRRPGYLTRIAMMPKAPVLIHKLKVIQPGLQHLAIPWISPGDESYIAELRKAARADQVEIVSDHLQQASDLPDHLRRLPGHADAIWLPADPLLINEQNLVVMAMFSSSSHIPYYASVEGMAEKGAVASVAVSYETIGKTAAAQARAVLSGGTAPQDVYPEDAQTTLNAEAAEKAGLHIDKSTWPQFEKVLP